jgi:hypothetical protein
MRRRDFMAVIGGAAFASPLHAQQAAKSYRVAYLGLAGDEDAVLVKQRLDELGYSDGKNLIFDFRNAEGQLERLPELAANFVATSPDVIVGADKWPRSSRPAPLRHLLPRRRIRQFQLSSSSALTRCRLALLPASTGRAAK